MQAILVPWRRRLPRPEARTTIAFARRHARDRLLPRAGHGDRIAVGAILSAAAGFIGMNVAVRSNVDGEAAREGVAPVFKSRSGPAR